MEDFILFVEGYQQTHSWWSTATFLNMGNQTLRRYVRELIETHTYTQALATVGTKEHMDELSHQLETRAPLMGQSVFTNLLDFMFRLEQANRLVSKEVLQWYRARGWNFPAFQSEKIETATLPNETLPILQQIADQDESTTTYGAPETK
jgi:hypothetical protein